MSSSRVPSCTIGQGALTLNYIAWSSHGAELGFSHHCAFLIASLSPHLFISKKKILHYRIKEFPQQSTWFFVVWQDLATIKGFHIQGGSIQLCFPYIVLIRCFLWQINKFFPRYKTQISSPLYHACSPFFFCNICTIGIFLTSVNAVAFPAQWIM